ncbi:MAG: CPBP family intramembrane metalloprotease [Chloroflexi bacterium]|nr:CPBP family intramembrane metalloprotease [Chloroflexota bacterium]
MSVHRPALPLVHVASDQLEVLTFLAIALGGSWPLMLVAGPGPLTLLAAWVPGVAALVLTQMHGRGALRRLGMDRLGWPDAYLFAIWVPVLFAAGLIAVTVALGGGRLDDDVGGLHLASGDVPVGEVVQQVVAAVTLAPLANAFVMLGSELGWRAFLLPRLLPLGSWRAITATSLFWWLWQLPLVLDPRSDRWPLEGASFLFWCLLVGEILGWLYLRTRSVWAPALFSGAIGATSFLPTLVLRDVAPDAASPIGPAALVIPALVVFLIRLRSHGEIQLGR